MGKGVMVLLLFGMLLVSPLIQAQEQTYSGFDRFVDNVKFAFSGGDNEVKLALEIREKEIDSAISNSRNEKEKDAIKNLERAHQRLQFINGKVSLDVVEEVKESVDKVVDKIEEEDLSDNFDVYVLEEKRTRLTAELTEKTYEYCKGLAEEDFALMLEDEECNPETAPEPLKDDLEKLKDLQERMFVQLMLEIRSCIDDPGTCNCEASVDVEQKAKCEKMVALAVKCEYTEDATSCDELEAMRPTKGDSFAESFVPEFLRNLFKEKEYMVGYDIEPSCGVPEECWDENDKPECRQYDHLKETNDDWDEYGNFIGTANDCGNEGPTMQEGIPQCFDGDTFLEEKCGEITMVKNEEGLINYIIGNDIESIIDGFENSSEQHLMEIRSGWMMVDNKWVIDKGQQNQGGNETGLREIKEGLNKIDDDIQGWVVDHSPMDVEGDNGLTWEIKTDVVKDGDGTGGLTREIETGTGVGDDEFETEVETDVDGGRNDPLPVPDLDGVNPDLYDPDARAPGDTWEVDDESPTYAEGTTADGNGGDSGSEGVSEEPSPAVDSNEGDSGSESSD